MAATLLPAFEVTPPKPSSNLVVLLYERGPVDEAPTVRLELRSDRKIAIRANNRSTRVKATETDLNLVAQYVQSGRYRIRKETMFSRMGGIFSSNPAEVIGDEHVLIMIKGTDNRHHLIEARSDLESLVDQIISNYI